MARLASPTVGVDRIIDQIYADYCNIRPASTSMEMLRALFSSIISGVQASPIIDRFGFDYVVRAGFEPRPSVDQKIRDLSRRAQFDAVRSAQDEQPALIRSIDFLGQLPDRGPGLDLRDYYMRLGIQHTLISDCLADYDWRYLLFVARPPGEPAYEAEAKVLFSNIAIHFRSALRARTRLIAAQGMAECFATGVEQLNVGVLVINAMRQIVEASPRAEAILAARDGLTSTPRLGATNPEDNRRLQAVIRSVSQADYAAGGIALPVERPSGRASLQLVVDALPVPAQGRNGLCVVYLRDPEEGLREPDADCLQGLFALTHGEALVARAAARGACSQDIATDLGISHNTVRAHLRAIFAKTGVGSRAALMKLLLSSLAMMAPTSRRDGSRPGSGIRAAGMSNNAIH